MSKEEKRYLQWGYESYRDTETGEVRSDYVDLLNKQDQQIHELQEQLENAIVLPIPLGEKCWTINAWQDYDGTHYELNENTVSHYEIYNQMINDKLTLQIKPIARKSYFGVQPYVFATREDAQKKLKELKESD